MSDLPEMNPEAGGEARTAELIERNNANPFAIDEYKFVPLPQEFSEKEVTDLLWYYEYYWLRYAKSPGVDDILKHTEISLARVKKITNHPAVIQRLKLRGIPWEKGWIENATTDAINAELSPLQFIALGVLSDPTSRGSLKSRLERVGVSYSQYRNWMNNPEFAKAMTQIGEKMVTDNISTVHTSMVAKAQAGDVQAMKLFYEVSGRHDPMRQQSLDLGRIVGLLLEVITRNVTDTAVLQVIEAEFTTALSGGNIGTAEIAGKESVHQYAQEMIDKYGPGEEIAEIMDFN